MTAKVWNSFITASARGANHELSGTCCQDAAVTGEGSFRGYPYLFMAVADGHGNAKCTHSERGSALAVHSAGQIVLQFIMAASGNSKSRDKCFQSLVRSRLRDVWLSRILESWPSRNLPTNVVKRHGTTLLIALIYRERIYLAQLGDGDICVLDPAGKAFFLIEPETGPVENITASLSGSATEDQWKFASIPVRKAGFLILSTDGLINSCPNSGEFVRLANVFADRMHRFRTGDIRDGMPQWLDDISRNGWRDDITVAAVTIKPMEK